MEVGTTSIVACACWWFDRTPDHLCGQESLCGVAGDRVARYSSRQAQHLLHVVESTDKTIRSTPSSQIYCLCYKFSIQSG